MSYADLFSRAEVRATAGMVAAVAIALVARNRRALSASGALAAVVVATACAAAGLSWAVMLILFFIAGTALSHIGAEKRHVSMGDVVEKTGARDAWQVFANGGVFAMIALASLSLPSPTWQVVGAGAIAASSADTWATEIGTLSRRAPRSIVGWAPVAIGTSGGVTWLGMCAALGGAAFVAGVTFLSGWPWSAACAALVGGFAGSIIDSILGATLQVRRRCTSCGKDTERVIHGCGSATEIIGGVRLLDNDAVNLISSIGGAMAGALCLL